MIKSTKRFMLSNESLNSHSFRVLTQGIDLTQFTRNPLMLWMHTRPEGNSSQQILPLGYWADIEVKGKELFAIPVFDDKDSFALSIYNKVESGVLKMASCGLNPLEWSEHPSVMVSGQTRPTMVKSQLVEASIVDVGSNRDALAIALYDNKGKSFNLSNPAIKADIIPQIKDKAALANSIVADAYERKKIGVNEILSYKKLALADIDTVKSLLDKIPDGYLLTQGLADKPFSELFKSDGLEILKKYQPEIFKQKFFEEYGKYPNN